MKRIVFTLCVFIVLVSLADAAVYYRCVDRNGRIIFTVKPPTDVTCELMGGSNESTPSERQQIQREQASERSGECQKAIENIIKPLEKFESSIDAGDYCRAADGIEVALNLLGICENECRHSRADMDKIAEWKRKLTVGLAVHQKECDALSTGERKKVYSGSRIILDVRDADIRAVFRMLAEQGKVKIIYGDDVKGIVTLYLKDVPWDQALDTLLDQNGYDKRQEGKIITVFMRDRK